MSVTLVILLSATFEFWTGSCTEMDLNRKVHCELCTLSTVHPVYLYNRDHVLFTAKIVQFIVYSVHRTRNTTALHYLQPLRQVLHRYCVYFTEGTVWVLKVLKVLNRYYRHCMHCVLPFTWSHWDRRRRVQVLYIYCRYYRGNTGRGTACTVQELQVLYWYCRYSTGTVGTVHSTVPAANVAGAEEDSAGTESTTLQVLNILYRLCMYCRYSAGTLQVLHVLCTCSHWGRRRRGHSHTTGSWWLGHWGGQGA